MFVFEMVGLPVYYTHTHTPVECARHLLLRNLQKHGVNWLWKCVQIFWISNGYLLTCKTVKVINRNQGDKIGLYVWILGSYTSTFDNGISDFFLLVFRNHTKIYFHIHTRNALFSVLNSI